MTPGGWSPERAAAYRRAGWWSEDTFAAHLDRWAARTTDRRMLSQPDRAVTWGEARRWTQNVAAALVRAGIARGQVVATYLANGIESYLVRIACERAGLVWLPVPRSARQRELRGILAAARPAAVIFALSPQRDVVTELARALDALPRPLLVGTDGGGGSLAATTLVAMAERSTGDAEIRALQQRVLRPEDVAMLIPTSGTTGIPKLVRYLLGGAIARGRAQTELFGIGPQDVIAATVAGFGPSITPLLAAPVAGAEVIVLDHTTPAELHELLEAFGVTIVCAVPPIYRDLLPLLASRSRALRVRLWYSTGTAMSPQLAVAIEEAGGGVALSGYGGVDLGCWTCPAPDDPRDVRHRTVGRPRGGTELRLLDADGRGAREGEVVARGPSGTAGYHGDHGASRWDVDGWFRTDDVGRIDERGDLAIIGRTTDVIDRGGQKIHPEEVEKLLQEHPAIAAAAVVPYEDERLGERACACLVVRDGGAVTLEELVAFLRDRHIASYKLPERIKIVTALPLTSAGKVSRAALRRIVADERIAPAERTSLAL